MFCKEIMSSLTAPWDRNSEQNVPSRAAELSDEQTDAAVAEQYSAEYVKKFPRVERLYADPLYQNQVFGLHSFVPAQGATPDKEGVYGFVKFRGAFMSLEEANQRAEWLIRNVDSYHSIHTSYVGRPFPICKDTKKFVAETHQVDIRKKAVETISEDIKQKKLDEKKEIEDIKEREQKLLDETREDYVEDPIERYTTLQVKKANLVYTYVTTRNKLLEMQDKIRKAYADIRVMDKENPAYAEQYMDKYMQARRDAFIPEDQKLDNFMKYMVEDADLDFDL